MKTIKNGKQIFNTNNYTFKISCHEYTQMLIISMHNSLAWYFFSSSILIKFLSSTYHTDLQMEHIKTITLYIESKTVTRMYHHFKSPQALSNTLAALMHYSLGSSGLDNL